MLQYLPADAAAVRIGVEVSAEAQFLGFSRPDDNKTCLFPRKGSGQHPVRVGKNDK